MLNCHRERLRKLTFRALALRQSELNQITHTHTENKDINDTIQEGTPQQLAPITAGPEHIK